MSAPHARKLEEFAARRYQETGRSPPLDELAQQMGLKLDVSPRAILAVGGMNFFSELEKDEYRSLRQGTPDLQAASPLENAIQSDLRAFIGRFFKWGRKLDARKCRVLKLRFGLEDGLEAVFKRSGNNWTSAARGFVSFKTRRWHGSAFRS